MPKKKFNNQPGQTNFEDILFAKSTPEKNKKIAQKEKIIKKAIQKSVPKRKPMTFKQRVKYEASYFILASVANLYPNRDNIPYKIKNMTQSAEKFIRFYEESVKNPGKINIVRGQTLIDLLNIEYNTIAAQNTVVDQQSQLARVLAAERITTNAKIRRLYDEAYNMDLRSPHDVHTRNLDRAKRIFREIVGIKSTFTRGI